ncbi:MAG: hypothetical protein M0C28_01460 [Candidatus Moduliflexus flocculans]|nr:hypothetical protein [Candidatus Moduliflexus flocculans]
MKRRDFVRSGVLIGTAALAGGLRGQRQPDPKSPRLASPIWPSSREPTACSR